jgi:hypothetical protein
MSLLLIKSTLQSFWLGSNFPFLLKSFNITNICLLTIILLIVILGLRIESLLDLVTSLELSVSNLKIEIQNLEDKLGRLEAENLALKSEIITLQKNDVISKRNSKFFFYFLGTAFVLTTACIIFVYKNGSGGEGGGASSSLSFEKQISAVHTLNKSNHALLQIIQKNIPKLIDPENSANILKYTKETHGQLAYIQGQVGYARDHLSFLENLTKRILSKLEVIKVLSEKKIPTIEGVLGSAVPTPITEQNLPVELLTNIIS